MNKTQIKKVIKDNTEFILSKTTGISLLVEWKNIDEPVSMTRSDWLTPTKDENIFSNMSNWDELDYAIKILGGVKLDKIKSYISDWGNGDFDKFSKFYYDFSPIFN